MFGNAANMSYCLLIFLFFLPWPGALSWSMGVAMQKSTEPEKTAASESMLVTASENLAKRKWVSDLTRAAHSVEPNFLPVADFCLHVLPGSYGNPNYDCRIYHVCQYDGRFDTLPCPETLRFSDHLGVCDWPKNVDKYCGTLNHIRPMLRSSSSGHTPLLLAPRPPPSQASIIIDIPTSIPQSMNLKVPEVFVKEVRRRKPEPLAARGRPAPIQLLNNWSSLFLNQLQKPNRVGYRSRSRPRYQPRVRPRPRGSMRNFVLTRRSVGSRYWRSRDSRVSRRLLP